MDEIKQIVKLQLGHLERLLTEKEITLEVTDKAITYIGETAFDSTFGARPIKRYINKELTQRVAQMLLSGDLKPGHKLLVDRNQSGELSLSACSKELEPQAV